MKLGYQDVLWPMQEINMKRWSEQQLWTVGSITSTSSCTLPPPPHVPFAFIYSQCSCLFHRFYLSVLARQGNKSCKIWAETCLIFRKKYSCRTYWMSSIVNTCNKRWWTFASMCKGLLASSNPYPSPAMGDFFQRASPAKTLLWLKKNPPLVICYLQGTVQTI